MKRTICASLSLTLLLCACTLPGGGKDAKSSDWRADLQTAKSLRQSGNSAQAVDVLLRAQASQPENPDIAEQLAYALVQANRPEEAVSAFDRWIALEPQNAAAYNGKGVAFDHTGNHLAAQELYQHALTLRADAANIRNNLAMSLILNGQAEQALPMLKALSHDEPENKIIRQNLALAYGLTGNKDKALALNMQDLPADQAQENVRFYESYAEQMKPHTPSHTPMQIGFTDTPDMIAAGTPHRPVSIPVTLERPVEPNAISALGALPETLPVVHIPMSEMPASPVVLSVPKTDTLPPPPAPEKAKKQEATADATLAPAAGKPQTSPPMPTDPAYPSLRERAIEDVN